MDKDYIIVLGVAFVIVVIAVAGFMATFNSEPKNLTNITANDSDMVAEETDNKKTKEKSTETDENAKNEEKNAKTDEYGNELISEDPKTGDKVYYNEKENVYWSEDEGPL